MVVEVIGCVGMVEMLLHTHHPPRSADLPSSTLLFSLVQRLHKDLPKQMQTMLRRHWCKDPPPESQTDRSQRRRSPAEHLQERLFPDNQLPIMLM